MLNFLEFIFLNFAIFVVFTGFLINHFRKYVPEFIVQTYLYGCFSYKGEKSPLVKPLEIPKSLFRHYYLFSVVYSLLCLTYMSYVYLLRNEVSWFVKEGLKYVMLQRQPLCVTASLTAMTCLTIQCLRRLYETYCIQVFAKSSKMNLSHYIVGIFHYFGSITAIIGQAPIFAGDSRRIIWLDTYTAVILIPSLLIFFKGFYEQYHSNLIFANLRKDDKCQRVVTEEYKMPRGRLFELVSSPHRLTEVMIYAAFLLLVPTRTFLCIFLWVIGNQVQTAQQAHYWYQATFKNYPKNRYVIFPYVF